MKYTSFGLANIVNIDFQYLIQGIISSDVLSIVTGYCSLNYVFDITSQQNGLSKLFTYDLHRNISTYKHRSLHR